MDTSFPPSAEHYDQWYANMVDSPDRDEIVRRHLGLPADLPSTSLLTWDAIADVTSALRLSPGQVLLDLACGRGGYGLEVIGLAASHAKHIHVTNSTFSGLGKGTVHATNADDVTVA